LQVQKRTQSKLLDRTMVEVLIEGKAGQISRKDAIQMVADELKTGPELVGIVALRQQSGTKDVWGRFYVYGSADSRKVHPKHLVTRTLTKEEREKLKQEKKKAKTAPAPAAEAKK